MREQPIHQFTNQPMNHSPTYNSPKAVGLIGLSQLGPKLQLPVTLDDSQDSQDSQDNQDSQESQNSQNSQEISSTSR